ncbi:MAG: alpha-2-macroglobulin domain protein, partial [Planctomycetaceae bacterium]|nr:alpha-2-macroglobulin domain protein [Planctomycetaceae bacterium]
VIFSQELDDQQKLPPITIEPPVKGFVSKVKTNPWAQHSLAMQGEFQPGTNYVATIGKTLLGENGQTLNDNLEIKFTIPQREPLIRFGVANGILSPKGNLALDLETVNVGQVRIQAQRIHSNNLVPFLHDEYRERDDQYARTVTEKTLPIQGASSDIQKHVLDLRQLLGQQEPLGIYRIEVRATDQTWKRDRATVTVSDLGMIIKRDHDSLWVWVSSLKSAQPAPGVRITAMSENNQKLVTGVTGPDGVARLPIDPKHPDGAPWIVVAEKDQDLVYQLVGRQEWVLDHIDHSGRPHPGAYDVLLYPERGVYRPGDTLHLTGLIRDNLGAVPSSFPLAVKVTRPDGRVAATVNVTPAPDKQGTFQFDFPTRDDNKTGAYEFNVTLPGAAEVLGDTTVLVEAFVPARIEVQADSTSPKYGPKDVAKINVRGRYLFGQPAADLPLAVTGHYQLVPFRSQFAKDFQFHAATTVERFNIDLRDLHLDQQGHFELQLPKPPKSPLGTWKATLTTTVTEPGGRSISRNLSFPWDTAERHIGLKADRSSPVNQDFPVEFILLSDADQPATPGGVQITLNQIEHETVVRRNSQGSMEWISTERVTAIHEQTVAADQIQNGIGKLTLKCPSSGSFRLVAKDVVSGQSASLELYARSQANEHESLALDKPEHLELVLDQPTYKPGSTVKVVVKSPFSGTLVLCLETDRILDQRILTMPENTLSLEIPIPANIRGGAFLTAAVVRPITVEDKSWLPHRAMGLARIVTDHSEHELPVQLSAPSQIRPGETVSVQVKTRKAEAGKPSPLVHVWAVDEGVLLATDFETPHPLKHFLGQRTLGVTTQDIYASLLPDHQRPVDWSRIGGDGEGHEAGAARRSLVPPKKIESVVLWQGFAAVDTEGQAKFDFQLPNFTGELRFMAVAVDGDHYGSTQRAVTVTSPLMLEANWPRFAAPGDEFRIPVKLFNSTSDPLSVELNLKVDGPLVVNLPPETGDITLPPNAPVTVWLPVRAVGMGMSNVSLKAVSRTAQQVVLSSEQVTNLPVRPGLPLHSVAKTYKGVAGTPLEIPVVNEFVPGTASTSVRISPQPALEFLPAVDSLLEYPYGCVEQTSSRIWALLAARDIYSTKDAADDKLGRKKVLDEMLTAGIHRLWSMQTRRGGLAYWPGSQDDYPWGTVYAAEVLAEASQHGIPVDSQFKYELLEYLVETLHERNGTTTDLHTKAQICHVLAKFQKPEAGWMSRLSEQVKLLDMESRAELALAWSASGRKDKALQILTDDTLAQAGAACLNGRITSPLQQTATLLNAVLEIDPEHAWVPELVTKLLDARKRGRWGNTAENAHALRALIRYQGVPQEPADYSGTIIGVGEQPAVFNSKAPAAFDLIKNLQALRLETQGHGPFFVTSITTGIMKAGVGKQHDHQIQIRRIWTDRLGKPVSLDKIKVGDLVSVQVTLQNSADTGYHEIPNVAVVDALPAGFEVENPRLNTSAQETPPSGEHAHQSIADHVEFLDDRIVLFAKSRGYQQTFRYSIRAVAVGRFGVPPIQASCMYDAGISSIQGGGIVEIKQ